MLKYPTFNVATTYSFFTIPKSDYVRTVAWYPVLKLST